MSRILVPEVLDGREARIEFMDRRCLRSPHTAEGKLIAVAG